MTNKERQAILDKKKWLASEKECCDKTGEMPYCFHCLYQSKYLMCQATQEERENLCLCAKAYNAKRKK
jgi:hypothetical protein